MNRRGFLGAILAAGVAPAIVRAESLMKIVVPRQELILPGMFACFPRPLSAPEFSLLHEAIKSRQFSGTVAMLGGQMKVFDGQDWIAI